MNVLLAIDESQCSEAAVGAVAAWYRPDGAAVKVVTVIQWPLDAPAQFAFAEGPSAADCALRAHERLRCAAVARVDAAVSRLRAVGFSATGVVVEGQPRQAILDLARDWPADVVVVGSHGRGPVDRLLLGSVSEAVVRHASCSVAVVRSDTTQRPVVGAEPRPVSPDS